MEAQQAKKQNREATYEGFWKDFDGLCSQFETFWDEADKLFDGLEMMVEDSVRLYGGKTKIKTKRDGWWSWTKTTITYPDSVVGKELREMQKFVLKRWKGVGERTARMVEKIDRMLQKASE